MERKDETQTGFVKKGAGRGNRDVVIFVFFLFLSFVFWYLNSLGKDIETGIKFPLKYTNLPKETVVIEDPLARLTLYIKGSGSSILKLKLSGKKTPVEIDISKTTYRKVPGSRNPDYYILTSGLTKSLAVQFWSGCEITSIKPDTLFFTILKSGSVPGETSTGKNVEGGRKR